ncbi:MAG: hypothetical protein C4318_04655 [Acidimicrobiia bacterium]
MYPAGGGVILFGGAILFLELRFRYRTYEKILKWLAFSIFSCVGVALVVRSELLDAVKAAVKPSLGFTTASLVAITAIFGTTISPYLFFWQNAEEVEEEREQNAAETTRENQKYRGISEMRADVASGMGAGVLVAMCIIYAAGASLNKSGVTDIATATQAAEALRPIAGNFSSLLFALGIIGTGLLAVPVLAGSSAYALADALGWEEGLSRPVHEAPAFYGIIVAGVVGGVAMNLLGLPAVKALYWSAVANGFAAPPLMLLINLLASSKDLMGDKVSGGLSKLWLWLGTGIMFAAGLASGIFSLSD